ncbi:Y-family DNA polymerase [Sphingomonas sp. FW199]|uniref:Y-family DNA polymerase n=1 Tax=Sphingomonas sp. FW199 TaxID=3400217 RepID=UPI003CEFEDA4
MQRRFLALWFPFLPTDRLLRDRPFARRGDGPLVLIDRQRGAMRLTACDADALSHGLAPGMTLADAQARVPALIAVVADPAADRQWLERIADACDRFTPLVEAEPPDALVLDMTGCLHRHDGEAGLIADVSAAMRRWASGIRLAMAATPEGARALARFQSAPARDEAAALRRLPVSALELDSESEHGLRRAGLKTIGDLADQPPAPLAARFGAEAIDRLNRVLGRSDSRITPRRALPALMLERRFAEPIATADTAMAVIGELAVEASAALEERRRGGRRFVARLYRSDGHVIDLSVESGLPLRDPARIQRLFEERVGALADPIDPGFGFDMIRLAVPQDEPLAAAQLALEGGETREEAVAALIDRLSTRVGRQRVRRFVTRDSHMPEQASLALPAMDVQAPAPWPEPEAGEPPLRPVHLFDPPQPVEVIAGLPDGPPQRFRWRRTLHEVARAEGPERISAEWWRRAPGDPGLTRDYYRVEDVRGRRFWLFRHGLYGDERADPRWYVHGLFA